MNKLITVPELAQMLKLSHSTIYRYVAARKIPHIKMEHNVLFEPTAIQEWLESRRVKPSISHSIKKAS